MQMLQKAIHDTEMRLAHNRLQVHQQAQQLKTMVLQKISGPKVLLGGLSVGVLLGLLRGKRHAADAESGAATGKSPRRGGWLRTIKTLARFAPVIAALNAQFQKRKKSPVTP